MESLPFARQSALAARTANQRLKARWRAWLLRSTLVAAAAHLVLLALWPVWTVSYPASRPTPELVQLRPVVSSGLLDEPEAPPSSPRPLVEEVVADGGGGMEPEDLIDLLLDRAAPPQVAFPVAARAAYGRPAPPAPPLVMNQIRSVEATRIALEPNLVWPLIRNPGGVSQYLRTRVIRAVRLAPASEESVSIAMHINERGGVEWAEVSRSSGQPALDAIALTALNEVALFRPARNDGQAVAVSLVITVLLDRP